MTTSQHPRGNHDASTMDFLESVEAAGNADPEIKPYGNILAEKYEKGAPEHVGPIVQIENAKQNWFDVQKATIP